jgi:serine/threonine protein kinase
MDSNTTDSQALPTGAHLEEFVIERVLGAGGFGITYLARDTSLGRHVVIKENLPSQFAWRETNSGTVRPRHSAASDVQDYQWSMSNFLREAETLASLDHPGIVRVLRKFEARGTAYFVMPFVDGVALDRLIEDRKTKNKPFTEDEINGLTLRMLGALDYLHQRNIYHRDIKPGNILITMDGIPILIDFGSARQRLSERSMTVIESAGYTPFEQLQTRGNIGPWSDLYALGGTLCKALTGEAPPKANDRAFDDPFIAVTKRQELATQYSMEFLQSIDKALAPRIADRWQNAADWMNFLNSKTLQNDEAHAQPTQVPVVHSAQIVINACEAQTPKSSGDKHTHELGGKNFYTEIDQVSIQRRSSLNSSTLLVSLLLFVLSLVIFPNEDVTFISMSLFFLSGLGILSVLIRCCTGDIYMNSKNENGHLKKWGKGNKPAGLVILFIYGLIYIFMESISTQ